MSTLLYNPDRKSKDQLISEFVVRTKVYDEIMHDLETSKMEFPEQHYLLVGQRGAGKTTLLNRLKYGIQDSEKLKDRLIPVNFNEEQYNISELANLWESIGQFLEDYQGFEGIYSEIEKHIGKKNFEELGYDILEKYLRKYNNRLVLLIDNIGDLLKKLDKTEVHRLREVLQTKKEIRLIAGSPFYLETILDYQQPLFEFFKVIRLDGLKEQETQSLLLKLGELNNEKDKIKKIINETPERIETLRTLTGGVPRTIALMYRIFTDYNDESTINDLERILDAVTPLYKHRMDDLPIQQQKIVDAVAKNWDAISVKDFKNRVRIDSKNISAQLRQLERNQVVEKKETGTKNHLYFVKERFFNIWYLMRYGRKDDKQRVIWLVRFLETWCSAVDLRDRIINYVEKIKTGELNTSAINFYGSVYSAVTLDSELKILLKKSTPINISSNIVISDEEIVNQMQKCEKEEKWEQLLELASNIENFDSKARLLTFKAVITLFFKDSENAVFSSMREKIEEAQENKAGILKLSSYEAEIFKGMVWYSLHLGIFDDELDRIFPLMEVYLKIELIEETINNVIIQSLFIEILAKGHLNLLNKIFDEMNEFNLKERFSPIYFALIYLKEGKDSIEFLKSGPELQETILDVLNRVEKSKQAFSKYKN